MTGNLYGSKEVDELVSSEDAIQYFKNSIWDSSVADERVKSKSFSLQELRTIYLKIVGIEPASKYSTRDVIVDKIIAFINSDVRARDLAKDLF